jgi:hypothetical protein
LACSFFHFPVNIDVDPADKNDMPQRLLPSWDSVLHALSREGAEPISSLVRLSTDALYISRPTPFPLRDAAGRVLIQRGVTLVNDAPTRALLQSGLWVDTSDAAPELLERGIDRIAAPTADADRGDVLYWRALRHSTSALLHAPREPRFLTHLRELHDELARQLEHHRDRTLLALIHGVTHGDDERSAGHALLCAAVATLAARRIPALTALECQSLTLAALTMNLSITPLHDELAHQTHPATQAQRQRLAGHARASARLLEQLGVIDPNWVQAVAHHHDATCGPLASRLRPLMLARLLQRADLFAAHLAPEPGRAAQSPADAVQAAYHAEDGLPDEAGMLLVRALGLYPPGSLVQLANGDLAVVVGCGSRPQWPVVATIASREGLAPSTPVLRTPGDPEFSVVETLAPREAWRTPALEELLPLTA